MPWKQFSQIISDKTDITKKKSKKKPPHFLPWPILVLIILFLLIIGLASAMAGYNVYFQNKIFPGISVNGLNLGGKTSGQAIALLQAKIDQLNSQGIIFKFNQHQFTLKRIVSGGDGALAYGLWLYYPDQTAADLFNLGRQGNWLKRQQARFDLLIKPRIFTSQAEINETKIVEILSAEFADLEQPGRSAALKFDKHQPTIAAESAGRVFDYELALVELKKQISNFSAAKIDLTLKHDIPAITMANASLLLSSVEQATKHYPLTIRFVRPDYYQGRFNFPKTSWTVSRDRLEDWLTFKINPDQEIYLGFDQSKISDYINSDIAAVINTPAKDAKFVVADGKVSEWQSSSDGFNVNIDATIKRLEHEFIANASTSIELILSPDKSKITNDNVNDLGIRELVGVGESNFSGSPQNRRHNIAVGADTLNGLLIKPAEEFSLLQALGPIDAKAGYKPELVIRDGKTVPEYGGGLCQIGTTMFRLAINTGRPVTERRNHSYRVSYYEPAGTDATIYNPWPDLKFINDLNDYLLLQTRIEGDNLIFEFWGSSDGRQVATTTPSIYNIVRPAPTKYIVTDELEPGKKRLLEHSHNGADTSFTRTVTWPAGSNREPLAEVWNSHYVAWQEVYLVGRSASSTEENVLDKQ